MTRMMNTERMANWLVGISAVVVAVVVVLDRAGPRRERFDGPGAQSIAREAEWDAVLAAGRRVGPTDARVTIVEFIDLECPACATFARALDRVRAKHTADVAVVYIHYPLPLHRSAEIAARAVECAAEQGKADEMIREALGRRDSLSAVSWPSVAQVAGVQDQRAFESCLADPRSAAGVELGLEAGARIGLTATPTVLVNGWRFTLPPTEKELLESVDAILNGDRPPFRVRDSR